MLPAAMPPIPHRLRRFLLVAFAWSWPLDLIALRCSPRMQHVVLGVAMWGPGLGALVAVGRPWRTAFRQLHRPRQLAGEHRALAVTTAFLLVPAVIVLSALLAVQTGAARWNAAIPRPAALLGIVAGGTLLSPLLNFPFALGEELGWRGFLFPTLAERSGDGVALALTGAVWGVWHAPLVVAGFNYPGHPWLAVPLMIALTSGLNLIFVALAKLGGTVTAPTFAHGSMNGMAGLAGLLLAGGDSAIVPPVGLLAWIPMALAGACLLAHAARRRAR